MSGIQELTALVQQVVATVASQATDMQIVNTVLDTLRRNQIADSADSADSTDTDAHLASV